MSCRRRISETGECSRSAAAAADAKETEAQALTATGRAPQRIGVCACTAARETPRLHGCDRPAIDPQVK